MRRNSRIGLSTGNLSINFYYFLLGDAIMKMTFKFILTGFALILMTMTFSACNTVKGFGQDMQQGGQNLQKAATDEQHKSS